MAGLTVITGYDVVKMFDILLQQKTEKEFNAAANMMVTMWTQLVPEWKPTQDDNSLWTEFCKSYPKAANSHLSGHPSMMTENSISLLRKIYGHHAKPLTKEDIVENPVIGTVTFVTHNAPWAQKAPHNNRVEYTIKLDGVKHPQAADQFKMDDCFLVWRHTNGNKKTLNLVTNNSTEQTSDTIKISLWLTKNDDDTYTYYCPGTGCFTGLKIGSNFNPWVAFSMYVNEINETYKQFTAEEKCVKYEKIKKQLEEYVETVKNNEKMWALSLGAL